MNYWLMKSEPDVFSLQDLQARGRSLWDGVRNYQARNFMRAMSVSDEVFFYHSSCPEPGIAGIMRICKTSYPDPTQFNPESDYFDPKSPNEKPRWDSVDVSFVRAFKQTLSLAALKAEPALAELALVQKGSRLSVMPVTPAQWQTILKMAD